MSIFRKSMFTRRIVGNKYFNYCFGYVFGCLRGWEVLRKVQGTSRRSGKPEHDKFLLKLNEIDVVLKGLPLTLP